jgi:hypothetical protein
MRCERCNGLMVIERICDLQGTNGELYVESGRCLVCGNLVDPMILENRRRAITSIEPMMGTTPLKSRPVAV